MGSRDTKCVVRVSPLAADWIRRRAEETGETVVGVVDRLVSSFGAVVGSPSVVGSPVAGRTKVSRTRKEVEPAPVAVPAERSRVAPAPSAVAPASGFRRCPECQCSEVMHNAGESGQRCERHPTCRWVR